MLLSPFAYYIALAANFDRLIRTTRFSLFFSIDCLNFFRHLRCVRASELRLIIVSRFFLQIFSPHVFTILYFFGFPNKVFLRSRYCAWGRAIQRPQTRSAAARQVSNAHQQDLVTNLNI